MAKVPGLRVHGCELQEVDVVIDEKFKAVPFPQTLGVPLVYKCERGLGDNSDIRSNVIVRMFSDPDEGLAPPEWQYGGGNMGPAPPTLLARRDGAPFSRSDWEAIMAYMDEWSEAMACEGPADARKKFLRPALFRMFIKDEYAKAVCNLAFLSVQFPVGSTVRVSGLSSKPELNGKEGVVRRIARDRVGVEFGADGSAAIALKPERLEFLKGPAAEAAAADVLPEPTQEAKDEEARRKKSRKEDLRTQDLRRFANVLLDSVKDDVMPRADDRCPEADYFGVGPDGAGGMHASSVFGVWCDLVKSERVGEEDLVEWLGKGIVEQKFKEWCKVVADDTSRTFRNQTYARQLVAAKFCGIYWETLD
eukprot:TRINITY_DN20932_c0_g1_i1.p1 TRINITY_DN20932_c0_g1~~TRINITY_DN20932_c0_g1_i1.p1  ORF type:complete len:363 (+),score=111.35 TRINITY_DN20932_c0_g1_i1:85-1173(+)